MNKQRRLWYKSPARDWETEALPIGNGILGGMIFGDVKLDQIQYNHKTLWSGGPGEWSGYQLGIREGAAEHLPSIRKKLANGEVEEADKEIDAYLLGDERAYGSYQNFGNLYVEFEKEGEITQYERSLNLEEGIASISFKCDQVAYTREYFCSYKDKVIVIHLSCDEGETMDINISMDCPHDANITYQNDEILNKGHVKNNHMRFESRVKVICDDGECVHTENKLKVKGAKHITLLMTAGTDYKNEYPHYKGEDPSDQVNAELEQAILKGYEQLRKNHIEDYTNLFGRVTFELDDQEEDRPTDELLRDYKDKTNPWLETLMFHYGRYLLIASSREGSLPANLQGVWNNSNDAPWCSDYHFNVNLQMCYWPAEVTNLGECAIPLIDYIDSLREPGRVTAQKIFGCKGNGWVVNTMNNAFGFTAPGWGREWGWTPSCNAWISQNLWEHYTFGRDKAYLKEKVYPIIKEAAEFWSEYLVEDTDGTLVSTPSFSSEHGETTIGATTDQTLVYELFGNVIEAGSIVGEDPAFLERLATQREKLHPIRIGQYGQLQEWKQDIDDPEDKHRHLNHMLGFFPGKQINKHTPEAFNAAVTTLIHRGDEGTGWSRANKINLWARALDGDHAYEILQGQLRTCTYQNLFDTHPPFQIDGNFGYVSGIAEMLLQSHNEAIELLPALPKAWAKGSISGLRARGGFGVSMSWENAKLTDLIIYSYSGEECRVEMPECTILNKYTGKPVNYIYEKGQMVFETEAHIEYQFII